MVLKENIVHIAVNGSHLRIIIRIAQRGLLKVTNIVVANHVTRREGTVSDTNVVEVAELNMPRIAQGHAKKGSLKWLLLS